MTLIISKVQYSTKMIFAVLDVSIIMGLNIGETDKVFFTLIFAVFVEKLYQIWLHYLILLQRYDQNNLIQYGRRSHVEFTSGLHFDTFAKCVRIPNFVQIGQYFAKL